MSLSNKILKFHPRLTRVAIRQLVKLHNYCHHKIAELASWLEGGIHPKHRITNYHQYFIDRVRSADRVLDVGCGIGYLAYHLAPQVREIFGIDFFEPSIIYAQKHHQAPNLKFIFGDINAFSFVDRFDKIVLSNVLEHIDDRVGLLTKLHQLSDTILFRVPMEDRDWLTIYKKELGLEYRLDSTHRIEYRLATLEVELAQAGWRIESYQVNWGELWAILKAV